jgi:hypothetical protein
VIEKDVLRERMADEQLARQLGDELGIVVDSEDPKIFTQKEHDELVVEYSKEHVDPLVAEIKAQEAKRLELVNRIAEKDQMLRELRKKVPKDTIEESAEDWYLPKNLEQLMVASLNGAADKISEDPIAQALRNISQAVSGGGNSTTFASDLKDIIADIHRFQMPDVLPHTPTASTEDRNDLDLSSPSSNKSAELYEQLALNGLAPVIEQLSELASEIKKCPLTAGAQPLGNLADWCRQRVTIVHTALSGKEASKEACEEAPSEKVVFVPPPRWNLGNLHKEGKPIRMTTIVY